MIEVYPYKNSFASFREGRRNSELVIEKSSLEEKVEQLQIQFGFLRVLIGLILGPKRTITFDHRDAIYEMLEEDIERILINQKCIGLLDLKPQYGRTYEVDPISWILNYGRVIYFDLRSSVRKLKALNFLIKGLRLKVFGNYLLLGSVPRGFIYLHRGTLRCQSDNEENSNSHEFEGRKFSH